MTLTVILCIAIAATAHAFISRMKFYSDEYKPHSFFGSDSWRRKYKRHKQSNDFIYLTLPAPEKGLAGWYYRFFRIKYKERFPLSATVLVFLTDGYHLVQFVMIKAIIIAASRNAIDFFVLWAIWLLFFNIFFRNKSKF